jgi:hypothetical protein
MSLKGLDYAKAAGVAVALLVLSFIVAILSVVFYAYVIDPGHPDEYYTEAAPRIVPWGVNTLGTLFFLLAGYLFARRQPERNALAFAALFVAFYALIDAATVGFVGAASASFALSIVLKLVAALVGALLGMRGNAQHAPEREPGSGV